MALLFSDCVFSLWLLNVCCSHTLTRIWSDSMTQPELLVVLWRSAKTLVSHIRLGPRTTSLLQAFKSRLGGWEMKYIHNISYVYYVESLWPLQRRRNVIQALPFNAARTAWFNRSEAMLLSGASIRTEYWQNMHKMPSVNLSLSKIYYSIIMYSN